MTLSPSQMAAKKIGFEKKTEEKPGEDVVVMPTFVPARMSKDEGILTVTTRQNFLNEGFQTWIQWHIFRALGILFAVAAIFLLTINLWLAAAAGFAAGHFYSLHVKIARHIKRYYTTRRLMYTR